jgi:Kef-type K+ transport system membrane component KefB
MLVLPSSTPLLSTALETAPLAPDGTLVLLGVLLTLAVIYLASKVGGEICARINLPPVLGELVGGVLVGVSVLHLVVFPDSGQPSLLLDLLGQTAGLSPEMAPAVFAAQSEVINVLSEIGVIILLFEIGLESDLNELIRVGPQAAVVACVGVAVPFAAGTLGLMALFQMAAIPAIFAGAALTATSIGITAKVLSELGRLNTREGQIIVGAAILDDILGIIVLAVVTALAKTGEVRLDTIGILIAAAATFLVGAILLGRLLSPFLVQLMDRLKTRGNILVPAVLLALVMGYVGQVIHLEAILGSFAAGIILGETDKREELFNQITPLADLVVPIFFVCVGAQTDLSVLNPANPTNREGLIIALFLLTVGILGKVITGLAVFGQEPVNRLAIGIGMIPRGEVGLVFAGVGSASGALSNALNAAIIVMVIATTFLAPPLLRVAFGGDRPPGNSTANPPDDAAVAAVANLTAAAEDS